MQSQKVTSRKLDPKKLGEKAIVALLTSTSVLPLISIAQAETIGSQSESHLTTMRTFSIPAGSLREALIAFGKQAELQISYIPAAASNMSSPGVSGMFSSQGALSRLLAGTDLAYRFSSDKILLVEKPAPSPRDFRAQASGLQLETINVEGQTNPNSTMTQPPAYAGGQVARGGRLGMLGNKDYMETPFSQVSLTSKVIRDQQAVTIADVLVNDPSVRATQSAFNYADNFKVRGFTYNGRDIAYDGLYGLTNNRRPEITGVDRVDILHGPGAFLFGLPPTSGIAGVINLVPKRANDIPTRFVAVDYLSKGNLGVTFDGGQRYGDGGQFGVRINGSYQDGSTPLDFQTFQHGAFTAALDYRNDKLRASIDTGYTHLGYNAQSNNLSVASAVVVPAAPILTKNFSQPWEYVYTNQVFALGRIEYDLAPSLTAFGAFGGSTVYETIRQVIGTISNTNGNYTASDSRSSGQEIQKSGELGLRGRFETGPVHHAVPLTGTAYFQDYPFAGGSAAAINSNIYNPVFVAARTTSASVPYTPSPVQLFGVAFADTMSILDDKVQLTGGIRNQWVTQNAYSLVSATLNTYYGKTAATPLGSVVFHPIKPLSFYVSYAEGLGVGPRAPTTAVNAGQVFAPIVSTQIEGGIKLDFDRIGASAAVFQITQASSFTDPNTQFFSVNGQQRNQGFELNVFGSPYEDVRILGGFQFMNGILTKTAGGLLDGKEAPGVPRGQISMSAEYDLSFVPGLTATGRVIYTSGQYYDQADTQSIPSWTRLDVGGRYALNVQNTKLTARFVVENVTGLNYWASTGGGTLALGNPRTFKASLSAEF